MRVLNAARRGGIAVAALWLMGVGFAVWSGQWHGMVDSRIDAATLPYEWRGVVFESVLVGLESLGLFWLLFKVQAWAPLARTLAATALYMALVAFSLMTFGTDLPGWCYVNAYWTMLVLLMLLVGLTVQLVAAGMSRLRRRGA